MDIRAKIKKSNPSLESKLERAMEDIILQYTYPRIDAEVSKKRNHLLKSPFVIHPGTGRVCVPIDPAEIDEFDPELVPTVGQVLRELSRPNPEESESKAADQDVHMGDGNDNGSGKSEQNGTTSPRRTTPDHDRTSLKPYIALFERHITTLMRENRELKKARGEFTIEF